MKYVVFGSGGHAKEVISFILSDGHEVEAVVSRTPFNDPRYNQFKIVDKLLPGEYPESFFILGVGDIQIKKRIVIENEDRWATFVHSSCYVSQFAKIGKGCVFSPNSCVMGDAIIGDFVTLNIFSSVSHDNIVGDFTTYSPHSGTMGGCVLGEEVFLGAGSYCIPSVTLPSRTKVSAGAIVRKSIITPLTLYGDPAAPLNRKV